MTLRPASYDAILLLSFGGPEGADDVMPFLERVTSGRNVPAKQLAEVARQYHHVGGISPLNEQCRQLRFALAKRLVSAGCRLPVYWGNRNWHPLLADTVTEMAVAGHRQVLAITTSAYSSYSGCRQYLEDIEAARSVVGAGAPAIHKVPPYYDHPDFVECFVDAVLKARQRLPEPLQQDARLVATAHSIPVAMAQRCDYEQQLRYTAQQIAAKAGFRQWDMVWQSRSGPASMPWLEPDVNDHLKTLAGATNNGVIDASSDSGVTDAHGDLDVHSDTSVIDAHSDSSVIDTSSDRPTQAVVLAPIGFVTDHMEVIWDLDVTAANTAAALNISLTRAVTPGTAPEKRFVDMWQKLIEQQLNKPPPVSDICPIHCCLPSD